MTKGQAVLILAALTMMGCGSQAPSQPKPLQIGWRPVGSWSGRGDTQTESFNIESGQWRIKWETKNETSPGAGVFKAVAHSAVSGRPLMVAVEHHGPGHDTAYVSDEPRLFHLVIESSNEDWAVKVEEAVTGVPEDSR